jgi:hypothetical protein
MEAELSGLRDESDRSGAGLNETVSDLQARRGPFARRLLRSVC